MAKQTTTAREARPGNEIRLVQWRWFGLRLLAAAACGVLLSGAFAPLEWWPLAWLALIPLLWLGLERGRHPFWLGYAFGIGHFTTSLAWLRTVFLPIPLLIALVCALYPAFWLWLTATACRRLQIRRQEELRPATVRNGRPRHLFTPGQEALLVAVLPAVWCALEWVRSWLFSGFPWNQLGISQWRGTGLLTLTRFMGVYGISLLLVAANVALYLEWRRWRERGTRTGCERWPWAAMTAVVLAAVLFLPPLLSHPEYRPREPDRILRAGLCQGDIPQIRIYHPDQLKMALERYLNLTWKLVYEEHPEIILWPETAVPAPMGELLDEPRIRRHFEGLDVPLLLGSVEYRKLPDSDEMLSFNSAMLLNEDLEWVQVYDKIHIVPFGEFVPFGEYLPFLVDWIGMGRGLTPGTTFTIFDLPKGARTGVNICYEDAFPEISAGFVQRGANLLVTITNDAWYERTSGSRQHMVHSIFRAAETFRPLLRSGNNADSCLILPTGEVVARIVDPETGSPFVARAEVFAVPIHDDLPITWYTRHGNVFARACAAVTLLLLGWCGWRWFDERQRLAALVAPENCDDK